MNDNEERPVTIITGRVWKRKGDPRTVYAERRAPSEEADSASGRGSSSDELRSSFRLTWPSGTYKRRALNDRR